MKLLNSLDLDLLFNLLSWKLTFVSMLKKLLQDILISKKGINAEPSKRSQISPWGGISSLSILTKFTKTFFKMRIISAFLVASFTLWYGFSEVLLNENAIVRSLGSIFEANASNCRSESIWEIISLVILVWKLFSDLHFSFDKLKSPTRMARFKSLSLLWSLEVHDPGTSLALIFL